MEQPKKWYDVYPVGTAEGDDESKVFKVLARNPKVEWVSTAQIVKASGLTRQRVEEILEKYCKQITPALIYQHPSNEENWGYWERCPDMLPKDNRDISRKDKDARIDNHLRGNNPLPRNSGLS